MTEMMQVLGVFPGEVSIWDELWAVEPANSCLE